jgi:MFS family permease
MLYHARVSGRWAMLVLVFLTRTSMGVQFQVIASVAPLLVADLGLGYTELGTLVGIYMLPGVVFSIAGGLLGQRFGDRRVVVVGLALMAIGAVVTAASASFAVAAAGRLISGVGAVVMNILLSKMIADWFAGHELATAMAVTLTSWPVGFGIGLATLGSIATVWSWRTAVNVTAASAVFGLLLMLLLYRDPPRTDSVTAAASSKSVPSRREISLAVWGGFAWGCFNAALATMIAFGPGVLIARGASLGEAGRTFSIAIFVTLVSVPAGGILADRWKHPNILIVVGSVGAGLITMLVPGSTSPLTMLLVTGIIGGAAPGAIMSLLPKTVRPEVLATAFGVYYCVFYLIFTVTPPIAGRVRDFVGTPDAPVFVAGAVWIMTVIGLALFRAIEHRAPR